MNKNEIIKTDTGEIILNADIIRNKIATNSNVTDKEIFIFLQLCKYRKLNPFVGEAHLVKYGNKAQQVVGKDVFIKRLNRNPKNEGWNSGVIIKTKDNKVIEREGTFYLDDEKLVGAWIKIYIKGWKEPHKHTVRLRDYFRTTNDNKAMGQWGKMPGVMIEKCCIVAGIRKAFPEEFSGMYTSDEIGIEVDNNTYPSDNAELEPIIYISKNNIEEIKSIITNSSLELNLDNVLGHGLKQLVKSKYIDKPDINLIQFKHLNDVKKYFLDLVDKMEIKAEKDKREADKGKENQETNQEPIIDQEQIKLIKLCLEMQEKADISMQSLNKMISEYGKSKLQELTIDDLNNLYIKLEDIVNEKSKK